MAIEKVKEYFAQFDIADRVREFTVSSATVELAAQALHCEPCRIAKTLSFMVQKGVLREPPENAFYFAPYFILERVDTLEKDTAQLLVQILVKGSVMNGLTLYHGGIHFKQRFNRRLIPAFCQS